MLVKPGERLASDGVIRAGRTALDVSAITGESVPVEVAEGDEVFAGAINGTGNLTGDGDRVGSGQLAGPDREDRRGGAVPQGRSAPCGHDRPAARAGSDDRGCCHHDRREYRGRSAVVDRAGSRRPGGSLAVRPGDIGARDRVCRHRCRQQDGRADQGRCGAGNAGDHPHGRIGQDGRSPATGLGSSKSPRPAAPAGKTSSTSPLP